jgi:hypothetical protein
MLLSVGENAVGELLVSGAVSGCRPSSARSLPSSRMRGGLLVVMCRSDPPVSSIFFSNSVKLSVATTSSS